MHTFICRDVRLHGWKPQGDVIEVNFDTPLSWLINRIKNRGDEHEGDVKVKLMCHGLPGYLMCCQGAAGHPEAGSGITAHDLDTFEEVRGYVKKIELHACLVARIGACWEAESLGYTVHNDGNAFCFKLAKATQAIVKASAHVQWYWAGTGTNTGVDFGHWNGLVFTWDETGAIVKKKNYPYTEKVKKKKKK
jgi:hypothetical protein